MSDTLPKERFCLCCEGRFQIDDKSRSHGLVGVCPSCLADARLGRMVRGMAEGSKLCRAKSGEWRCFGDPPQEGYVRPEEALEAAGVKV